MMLLHLCRDSLPNQDFITLIPKIDNPIRINDYRPINLIGIQFKIIAKLLANRLAPILMILLGWSNFCFLNPDKF